MDFRIALSILLIPALLLACADNTQTTSNRTSPTGPGERTDNTTSLSITYSGGLLPPDRASSVFSVQDDRAAYTSMGANNSVLRVQERRLSPDEQAKFQRIMNDIGSLKGSYGEELRGRVADAGTAQIVIVQGGREQRTVIDPNVGDAYPSELKDLLQWVNDQMRLMQDKGETIGCTDPRPENCAQVNDPVCGSNGKTYSNGCTACADASVDSYKAGQC